MKHLTIPSFFYRIKKREIVPKTIFAAYLQGGRTWPQRRWADNIFVLDALAKVSNAQDPYNQKNLNQFFNSQFSSQQLQNLRSVMTQDHRKGEIDIQPITDEILNSQWLKTKIGVHRTLLAFLENTVVDYYTHSDYASIVAESERIAITFIGHNLSLEQRLFIKSAVAFTKGLIVEHKELSRIFILSYYSEQKRNESFLQIKQTYPNALSIETNAGHLRDWTEKTLFSNIRNSLENTYKIDFPWIIYDSKWCKLYPAPIPDARSKI